VSQVEPQPPSAEREARYQETESQILAVLEGERDLIARMATVAALLSANFPEFLWTGFYRREAAGADGLVIGPYQGALGCLRIAFGRGVCGAAAAQRRTLVVEDVHAFAGHIACDSRAESEIVVPVFDCEGELIAVLDVDAACKGAFGEADARALEGLAAKVFAVKIGA
jgi:GAF domain-containing protein